MPDEHTTSEAAAPAAAGSADAPPGPRMASVPKIAARYGIPCNTLWRLVREGRLEAVVVSRRTLVVLDSVERFVAALPRVGRHAALPRVGRQAAPGACAR